MESIQSGLYWRQLGMIRELLGRYRRDCFPKGEDAIVVATGGFAGLCADSGLFNAIHLDLVLKGIRIAQTMNEDVH